MKNLNPILSVAPFATQNLKSYVGQVRPFLLFLLVTGLVTNYCHAQGTWTPKADFGGGARRFGVAFSIGTKGYLGTGTDGTYKKDFWEFDPGTNVWTQKADFGGTARQHAVGFAIGAKGYVGTGLASTSPTYPVDFWEFDPSLNTWTAKANFGGVGRYAAVAFSIGTKGYLGTGYTGSANLTDFWEYNSLTNAWVAKANFAGTARRYGVGFSIGSKGYLGTGYDTGYLNDFWEFDTTANTWAQKAAFGGSTRYLAFGFASNSKGYIGGGYNGSYKNDFWEYSPSKDSWFQKADFGGSARYGAKGFFIGTKGYVGTGYDASGVYKADFFEYDRCGTFSATTSKTNSTCGMNDGTASITPTGGTTAYSYSWSSGGNTPTVSGLYNGNHTANVTDDNGCVVSATIFIGAPAVPTINSFSPLNAYPGDTLTITGTNFGSSPSMDFVNFGRVLATSISGNDTLLKVVVPPGAANQIISVTNNCAQTVYSSLIFTPRFYCADPAITTSTFGSKLDISSQNGSYDIGSADFDGDGKTDLAITNNGNGNTVMIFRNTSSGDTISFLTSFNLSISPNTNPQYVAAGDIDGDGKPDLVIACQNSNKLLIYKNSSFIGNISFTLVSTFTFTGLYAPVITDMDMDGKADVVVASNNNVFILRNTGKVGQFSFVQKTFWSISQLIYRIAAGDLDGDNKPDLALGTATSTLYILKNNCSVDNFSSSLFSFPITGGGTNSLDIDLSDLDLDGKLDVIVPVNTGDKLALFKNTSSIGSINLILAQNYSITAAPRRISIADINGDNLPDISVGFSNNTTPSIIKNNGGFSFAPKVTYPALSALQDVLLTDLNGNGKPDFIFTNNSNIVGLSIYKNQNLLKTLSLSTTTTDVLCFGGSTGTATDIIANGTPPYKFSWSNGQTSNPATGLSIGNYNVTVTDSLGCRGNTTGASTAVISQPDSITITGSGNNINCFGASTGAVTINSTGGVPAYSSLWSNGATTSNLSNVAAGTYSVTVTDDNNCTQTKSFTVTQNSDIGITVIKNNVTCNGACNGNISATNPTGGVPPYTYLWSTGANTASVGSLCPNTYSLTITDNLGCTKTGSATVTQPTLLTSAGSKINISCNGLCNGSALVTVNGGTSPYSYNWSNGKTNSAITGLCPGTFSATISDANGCLTTSGVSISQPTDLTLSLVTKENVNCFGNCNGSITVAASGGTSPYNYLWADGKTTPAITGLCAGSYSGTVTDANGCTSNGTIIISEPTALTASCTSTIATCGNSDGTATATASGGTIPYSYSWSNGMTGAGISGIPSGAYTVTVTDANNCTKTASATVSDAGAPALTISSAINVSCFGGSNGSATANVSGGTSPFNFLWDDINAQATQTASGLTAGTYAVVVTDGSGCSASKSITLTEPFELTAIVPDASVLCFGDCNGNAVATANGGTNPYTYIWSDGNSQTGSTASGLCPGNYYVTVTDSKNCIVVAGSNINEPPSLSAGISVANATCNGLCNGNASVNSLSGGTSPYSYLWSNTSTASSINSLCSSNLSLTVTDVNGCNLFLVDSISEPTALVISSFNQTNVSCFGGNNGSLNPEFSGGTQPYSYLWSNGNSGASLSGLSGGTYKITFSDANNCSMVDSVTIAVPGQLSSSTSKTDLLCNGICSGSAQVTVSGGTTPYSSYQWNEAGNYSSSQSATGLCAGTPTVTATDANGCTISDSINISQPDLITVTSSSNPVSCFGICDGSASVTVSGGLSPYTFFWSTGKTSSAVTGLCPGTYSVTITDGNFCSSSTALTIDDATIISAQFSSSNISCSGQCNGSVGVSANGGKSPYTFLWNNGNTTASITGLCAGTYSDSISVFDSNGCSESFTNVATISEPDSAISVIISKTNGCNSICNGNASVTGSGGVSPYTYKWSNGDTLKNIQNLCANIYTVTVTDANGCNLVSSANISQSPPVSLSFFKTDVNCYGGNDGTASVSVSGGIPSYNYLWSNGSNSGAITDLTAGTYNLTVNDVNGCGTTGNITLISPSAIIISFSVVPAGCGSATGSATATVSGGTGPYSYLWSAPGGPTGASANSLAGGNYFLTVTDNKGCKKVGTVNVGTTSGLTASFNSTNINCSGTNNGTATITPSGGTPPFVYLWSNGQNSQTITGLSSGTFSGTVTDNTGCAISGTVQINQPPSMNLSLAGYDASGCGNADGNIDAFVNGGVSPYDFYWSTGDTTQNLGNLSPGNYSLTVTDANGCSKYKSHFITAPSTTSVSFSKTDVLCNGSCDGTAMATATGGIPPYSFYWSDGNYGDAVGGLCPATYFVTVVDSSGCAKTDSIVIGQPNSISMIVSTVSSSCGVNNGSAMISAGGGNPPYNYQWSSGDTLASADSLSAGIYAVTVFDNSGCSNFTAATISDTGGATVTVNSITQINCYGENSGAININVTGGNTPYIYSWSNGYTTQDLSNLTAGPYEVSVSDANGCLTTKSLSVVEPPSMEVTVTSNDATCGSFDGSTIINTLGGTSPYSYLWSNGATSSSLSALASGIYSVTVTDIKGCDVSATAAIAEIGGPTVTVDSIINPGCGGNGSVFVSVSLGTSPYLYSWSNGLTSEDLVGVGGGTYNLLVTDANGCKGALTAEILQQLPGAPEICLITVDSALGTNKIVWQKYFGLGISSYKVYKESTQAGVYQLAGTVPFDSLSLYVDPVANPMQHSWRYKLSVLDSCGNESPMSAEHKTIHLTINQGIGNTINLIWDHYQGFYFPTYYISRYKPATGWVLIDSLQSNLSSYTDFDTITPFGLRYFVEVKHPIGCSATKSSENHNSSRSNKTSPLAPTPVDLNASETNTPATQGNCDGSATITATGGIAPYSFLWDDLNSQTTGTASGLCAGIYNCTITDSEGDSVIISITIATQIGITENSQNHYYRIFPNPNKGKFIVQVDDGYKAGNGRLRVINILGETIYEADILNKKSEVDIGSNRNGIYFLQVLREEGISLPLKIILQR